MRIRQSAFGLLLALALLGAVLSGCGHDEGLEFRVAMLERQVWEFYATDAKQAEWLDAHQRWLNALSDKTDILVQRDDAILRAIGGKWVEREEAR